MTIAQGRKDEKSQRAERALYGKMESKKAISGVLHMALRYRFTSLPEFNAVLRQFNVTADRGKEESFMYAKKGLLYVMLDKRDKKIGVPIKASSFFNKPTLAFLEKQFKLNEALRLPHKQRLMDCIDQALSGKRLTKWQFVKALNNQNVFVVFRQNEQGLIYGITLVDNVTKSVFNGSDLGKAYSAKAITCQLVASTEDHMSNQRALESDTLNTGLEKTMNELIEAKQYDVGYPGIPRKKKRKKHKRYKL